MNPALILLTIIFPIICGAILPLLKLKPSVRERYLLIVSIINSVVVFFLLFNQPKGDITLISFTENLSIAFHVDGLSMVFAGLVAGLWPLAMSYGFEYMKHEGKEEFFFTFYTMTYGVVLGIAFAANMITMYLFYELLTLITLPLVMHGMSEKAINAGRKYLLYSIGGASAALMGIIMLHSVAGTTDFAHGGVLVGVIEAGKENFVLAAFVICFVGFGVKAAIFPLHSWLPTAGVAPTPVTALLHAVAVVKAGVFAIMRTIYYSFGAEVISGTKAHDIVMLISIITIVFGSAMAIREDNLKRRLAYSTVSNLSYIIFGAVLMTADGFMAGMSHMVFHGIMKICLFFCAGAVIVRAEKHDVSEMSGLAKRMPKTFFCFTVGSLALTGIPLFCGFISKWNLGAAAAGQSTLSFIGICALMISTLLTAIYLFTVIVNVYAPVDDSDEDEELEEVSDPSGYMTVPLFILCALMLIFGLFSEPLMNFLRDVSIGAI